MREICQKSLKFAPWMEAKSRKLPGVQPLEMRDWLQVDDAFGAQMAERARLIEGRRGDVLQMRPEAEAACAEALELALTHLPEGFSRKGDQITRPDGVTVGLEGPPMEVLSRLVVEDFCILQKHEAEHVLTAALLCFPASWSLAEKFGHPLSMIHDPVAPYTDDIARRVQRLFDAVGPDRPLWRANALLYAVPDLYQPRGSDNRRVQPDAPRYLRSERQSILRLPKTGAVLFSIHTSVVRMSDLSAEQARGASEYVEAVPI
jgi:hypothetical protein